ncbi:hypothetical protein V6Z12_A13G180500 [Gossypium hirsutum]
MVLQWSGFIAKYKRFLPILLLKLQIVKTWRDVGEQRASWGSCLVCRRVW